MLVVLVIEDITGIGRNAHPAVERTVSENGRTGLEGTDWGGVQRGRTGNIFDNTITEWLRGLIEGCTTMQM